MSYDVNKMIEIELRDDDAFLQIKETLRRCGVANFKTHTLYQSCHILHKRGRYYIAHFKEMFALDGKCAPERISEEDYDRRNRIAELLEKWGLCVLKKRVTCFSGDKRTKLFVLKHKELEETDENGNKKWKLESKYDFENDY